LLKAAIVYLQGSGGNLLTRTLSLSEQTVAYLPSCLALQQTTLRIPASDRFKLYNNWNSDNWADSEDQIRIWYHCGIGDFFYYEDTDLWLIDQFHPHMFEKEMDKKILFASANSWEHLIFIKWKQSSLNTIKKLARVKRPDMTHQFQIDSVELECFEKLMYRYPLTHIVNWEDMLEEDLYIQTIKDLSGKLNLILDFSLVRQLWKSWKTETEKLLND
jgi:hypothetical protein